MNSIKLLKRAENELYIACRWYEEQQPGLLSQLRIELDRLLKVIAQNPDQYTTKYNTDLRFAPLKVFPYFIVYWCDDTLQTVFILSVFHQKRNPKSLKSGLK